MRAIVKVNGKRIHKRPIGIVAAVMKAFRLDEAYRLDGIQGANIEVEVIG